MSNTGGQPASTTLTETVPAGTSYTGSGEGWSTSPACAAAGSSCTQAVTAPAAGSITAKFTVTVQAPVSGDTVLNTLATSAGDCTVCELAVPTAVADMQASGAVDQVVDVGTPVTVVTQCSNAGPAVAEAASCRVSGGPADAVTVCKPAVPVASLAVGAVIECTTSFTPSEAGSITLITTASSSTPDLVPDNNEAPSLVEVQAVATVTPVPVDGKWMLALLALGLIALTLRMRRSA